MSHPKVGVNGVIKVGYEEPEEHYEPRGVGDFDFPMSYDFRSFIENEIIGRPLPSLDSSQLGIGYLQDLLPEEIRVKHIYHHISPDTLKVEQLKLDVAGLKRGFHTHSDKKPSIKKRNIKYI